MINVKSKIIKILFVILIILLVIISIVYLRNDLAFNRSSALFGGKIEKEYQFAGFLASFKNNKVTTCGVVFINNNTAVTAAHCVLKDAEMYVGKGEFDITKSNLTKVLNFVVNPNWSGLPFSDIAILNLENNIDLNLYAKISAPKNVNCDYVIVGYGQNETSVAGNFSTKQRKSIEVCINSIAGDIAYIKGLTGGICYGDSGSPMFKKSTNEFVGIVSSIVSLSKDINSYCAINNNAAVVLPQNYSNFIAQENNFNSGNFENVLASKAICGEFCTQQNDCANGLTCQNSKCQIANSNSCIAKSQNFCASSANIDCDNGNSCIGNVCIAVSEITNKALTEVNNGITPIIIIIFGIFFIIVILAIIPNSLFKKR